MERSSFESFMEAVLFGRFGLSRFSWTDYAAFGSGSSFVVVQKWECLVRTQLHLCAFVM